ncbi:MAG: tungstate ABC transporter substrate-binding protein WtpA [Candidatus Wallbacteria bacterium HGW-Wallbacteria-1]|jgi:molybdate/tungstate transport system substrate-binding protein|uniref:Tungstate ABC transporter substrate-binding protein WtpA n=1 Tax=Candidatus Wallbacteria bacterium HGW-Wallbacteria-1 TaxID=2013854 RepID=A0A2N1PQY9_9BACT|nr:MAG: tungstate ABC transporter substrate-binding protein WtpA [Candidatus Wallbacteria bacterium HGW-Wallbacteria-1]
MSFNSRLEKWHTNFPGTFAIFMVFTGFFCIFSARAHSQEKPSGKIIVFHAGSMAIPLENAAKQYEKSNPGTRILLEASGSRVGARKISELNRQADIFISADSQVITDLLFPDHASWSACFATNEMVIVFTETSRYSAELTKENWFNILSRPDVSFGMSDPECDPAGYRTLLLWQLADLHYRQTTESGESICKTMLRSCPSANTRPSSIQLLPLIESLWLDYCFEYRSVAEQHRLKYLRLPAELNLSDPALNSFYEQARIELRGNSPKSRNIITGSNIKYALTVPHNPPNPIGASSFAWFLLYGEGRKIMERHDQPLIEVSFTSADDMGEKR